jgi:hypothetical protein
VREGQAQLVCDLFAEVAELACPPTLCSAIFGVNKHSALLQNFLITIPDLANPQKDRALQLFTGDADHADNALFAVQGGPKLAQQAQRVRIHKAVLSAGQQGQLHHVINIFGLPHPHLQIIMRHLRPLSLSLASEVFGAS